MKKPKPEFHVSPKYTSGSPAIVDESTAKKVAKQEEEAYKRNMRGIYGLLAFQSAEARGLDGIVEKRIPTRNGWEVEDLITGKKSVRLAVTKKSRVT